MQSDSHDASAKHKWPYQPRYLTEIFDGEEVLKRLLAGMAKAVNCGLGVFEEREGKVEAIRPVDQHEYYPSFCGCFLDSRLTKRNFGDPGSQEFVDASTALNSVGEDCVKDQRLRAKQALDRDWDGEKVRPCHMNLSNIHIPIELDGKRLAVLVSGCLVKAGCRNTIAERVRERMGRSAATKYSLRLLEDIEQEVTESQLRHMEARLNDEIGTVLQVADRFLSLKRKAQEAAFYEEINQHLNEINPPTTLSSQPPRGSNVSPEPSLKERVVPILEKLKVFFGVPFVALFCSEKPNDTVLPLFAQTGFDNGEVQNCHFNWKKASRRREGQINPHTWLRDIETDWGYVHEILEQGIKGPSSDSFHSASFALPFLLGTQYRGLVLLGSGIPAKGNLAFLGELGQVLVSRILALVALEALNERDKWRDNMTKLVAHEFRTEMQKLFGEVWEVEKRLPLMNMEVPEQNRLKLAVDRARGIVTYVGNRATTLMRLPRAAVALRLERDELRTEVTSLPALVHNCAERHESLARNRGLAIETDPSVDQLPMALVDQDLMRLLLGNILDNAIKYAFRNTRVLISGRMQRSWHHAQIRVENLGIEIPQEDLERIFELGYRTKMAQAQAPGDGIGLFQARHLVTLHDGRIWAECAPSFFKTGTRCFQTIFTVELKTILGRTR